MTELVWDGKYSNGKRQAPTRIALPFQNIETVNEGTTDRQRSLELFSAGRESHWRNRLIWGDKKYVLPSLLPEFSGMISLARYPWSRLTQFLAQRVPEVTASSIISNPT